MTEKRRKIKLGRRLSYKNSKDLEDMIIAYFKDCQHNRIVPNKAGLCNYLGICKKTFYTYLNDPDYLDYNDVMDRAILAMEDFHVQGLYSKFSSGAQFALKNQHNWNAEENIKNTNVNMSLEDYLSKVESKDEY